MKYHNIEIESAIITCILSKPPLINQVIDEINPYDFENTNNKIILWVLYKINNDGNEIELNTVIDYLKKGKKYNQVKDHLTDIMAEMPASTGLTYYLKQIKEGKVKTQLVSLMEKLNSNLKSNQVPTDISIQDIFSFLSNIDNHKNEGITELVKKYIDNANGTFYLNDIYNALVIKNRKDKHSVVVALSRLSKEDGILKKSDSRAGQYRIINQKAEPLDWKTAKIETYPIVLPLGMHEAIRIMPKTILAFAGVKSTGKTTFGMNIAAINQSQHKIYYYTSEIIKELFKERAMEFDENYLDWNVDLIPIPSPADIPDVIMPDGFNIIDYIEPPEGDYSLMTNIMRNLHNNLKKGIAVVFVQKKSEDFVAGGEYMKDKPLLFCYLDKVEYPVCKLTIKENKIPKYGYRNPVGQSIEFKVARDGIGIVPFGKFNFEKWQES